MKDVINLKKYSLIIIVSFFIVLMTVSARAGGGGSGGSGSGGGSSHTHTHTNTSRVYPGASLIVLALMGGSIYYLKHEHIRKMQKNAKKDLEIANDLDTFWNENDLKEKVKKSYYLIQEAWSKQDLDELKKYLSDDLYQQWLIKIEWQKFRGERNELTHIRLLSKSIISIHDDEDNTQDYFWVAIEGKMHDEIIKGHEIISINIDTFIEYWKFIRIDDYIVLDRILQEDEWNDQMDI